MTENHFFYSILEQYVVEVADKFIESASPEGQSRLINLLINIGKQTEPKKPFD